VECALAEPFGRFRVVSAIELCCGIRSAVRSLTETGLVGVARIAMHRREHIVIVRSGKSGLIAHTMYFSSEYVLIKSFKPTNH
jgi:hypothetical protein